MFEKFLIFVFWLFRYRLYANRYNLPASFRFNGYFILFRGGGEIIVGENSYVSYFSNVVVPSGTRLIIGSDVRVAHNVRINTESIDANLFKAGKYVLKFNDIRIGNNVLIGNNSYVGPGVQIGDNVVIPPNSTVTSNVPSNTIYRRFNDR